jgi:hypothetical protein
MLYSLAIAAAVQVSGFAWWSAMNFIACLIVNRPRGIIAGSTYPNSVSSGGLRSCGRRWESLTVGSSTIYFEATCVMMSPQNYYYCYCYYLLLLCLLLLLLLPLPPPALLLLFGSNELAYFIVWYSYLVSNVEVNDTRLSASN